MDNRQRKTTQQRNRRLQKINFNTFKKQQQAQPCHCKCGGYAKPGNKFINGHYRPKGKNNPSYGKSYNKGISKKKWRSFEEAREFARSLGLKGDSEWRKYCKSGDKPYDVPVAPHKVYKDQGWINMGDWLGTGNIATQQMQFRPFKEARKFVRSLGLKRKEEWSKYCKSGDKPYDVPVAPGKVYKDQGWKGWGDWLGTGNIAPHYRKFKSFEEARKFVRSLGLKGESEWRKYCKSGDKPYDVPVAPGKVYKDQGWKGWGDWLGTGNIATQQMQFRPFKEAREFARSLGLKNHKEWEKYCRSGEKPDDIPSSPRLHYKDQGWKGSPDWLNSDTIADKNRKFKSFEEARKFARSLGLKRKEEWEKYCESGKRPDDIPATPNQTYEKEWIDWSDFLGYEDPEWTVRRIKELLRGLIESNVIREWTSKKDEIVLYRILHTKGLLNLQHSNRHFEFFKNLPEAMHVAGALKEIKEYAYSVDYSNEETPPDLTKYTGIHSNQEDENENVGTASTDELAELVHADNRRKDPLDYDSHDSIETPTEILKSIDRIESIIVDEEVMRFLVIHSINKIWDYIIAEYEKEGDNKDHIALIIEKIANSKNGNHYRDEVIDKFLSDYNGSLQIKNNLPEGYSFKYKPKIMQAYVAHKIKTQPYFLNLSGVGAGKTLSAILASRLIDKNKMTIIVCPNDIVGQWAKNIKEVFPDSSVTTGKEAFHVGRDESENKMQYLVLNYDKFSLDDSPNLILELGKQKIDFVILDEIHFVKVRGSSKGEKEWNRTESKRHKHLVGLMTEIREKNKDVKVLGMTATPVINDLMEGRSLIELVTGKRYNDVSVNPTIPNASTLYEKFQLMSVREMPDYKINVNLNDDIEVDAHTDDSIRSLTINQSHLEQKLTEARIPEIIKRINKGKSGKTIIFTEYVTGITDQLREAVKQAGYSYAEYTGSLKEYERFCKGKEQVLIASRPIVIGKDGLQAVCDNIIINTLPWTNAQYQQLIGRLVRRGQAEKTVNVHIIKARLNGYPYDERMKWNRIIYKRTLADCAVDGVMPIKNLATRSQAMKELEVWFDRLNRNELSIVERKDLNEKLTPVEIEQRIRVFGSFAQMNKQINMEKSETTHKRIEDNPMFLVEYHRQMREAKKEWGVIPVNVIADKIARLQAPRYMKKLVIGDFGCGEAELSLLLPENKVHSFDHHNILAEDRITPCDMKQTPLPDEALDVAVFSLSLMSTNWTDYLREARRCLTDKGYLMIAETSRSLSAEGSLYTNDEGRLFKLKDVLREEGFEIYTEEQRGRFTFIDAVKTNSS